LRVTGPAVTVLEGVFVKSGGGSEFGVSRDGTLFYVEGTSYGEIVQVDMSGQVRVVIPGSRAYGLPTFSPTSGRIAYALSEASSYSRVDVWVYNDLTRTSTRLTNDGKSNGPSWMPDGERVIWTNSDSSRREIRRQKWDGTGRAEVLFPRKLNLISVLPAPTGHKFAVVSGSSAGDVAIAEGDPPTSSRDLVVTAFAEGGPQFSPDGNWVAYYSDASGRREVYVTSASGDGARQQVSAAGGNEPHWSHDGKTLFYRGGGRMMAAKIVTTPAFAVTSRTSLFADLFSSRGGVATYDVARDDKSFLMVSRGDGRERIIVVTGWLRELKARTAQGAKR
jgi:Tol biopolymer transport system component